MIPWSDVATKLRPFVARRTAASEVDDVLQDVLLRMHRSLGTLADEERFTSWMFTIARNAIAEHGRARSRHPLAEPCDEATRDEEDDRVVSRALSACISMFVAQLDSPYREAVTLVELEGLTAREAAEMAGVTVSGMKSRVQRGRARLRVMFERCCRIELDARGKVTDYTPRKCESCG
jgi:RNA polymerase sigma-70 factor (ECF subfamily)